MKKLVSLVLALAMILLVGAAFADVDPNAKDVKVTGLDNGDEVTFYKVVEWVGETDDDSDVTGWKATSGYSAILDHDTLQAVLLGTPASEGVDAVAATGITPELANDLAKAAANGSDPVIAANGEATLEKAAPGIYMALVKPADVNTVYNPIFVSVDFKGANNQAASTYADSTAKKSTLTLTKTAANASDYNGDNGKTTAIGDKISYTVVATIPAYGTVYTNPHYAVKDTLTDLTLDTGSIKVNGETSNDNWSVEATSTGYTITFSADYLKTIKTATNVTITYDAIVATTAAKAINEESNDVMIEYSHDPSDESDYDVKKDTTQHYTFTIDAAGLGNYTELTGKKTSEFVKIGVDGAGNPINQLVGSTEIVDEPKTWNGPLEGAVFGLWKNAQCEGDAFKTATTSADGRMTFAGLDAGTYYLKEISAPDGFVTNSDIHTVVLTATFDTVAVTEYWTGTAWSSTDGDGYKAATYDTEILKSYSVAVDGETVSSYSFTNESASNSNDIKWTTLEPVELPCQLVNTKGVELPSTGGIGTTIFYVLGGLLVVGAAVLLIVRRKAKED